MPSQAVDPRPLDPESGGSMILRNVTSCLPVDTATLCLCILF